jgi:hypothetical protein
MHHSPHLNTSRTRFAVVSSYLAPPSPWHQQSDPFPPYFPSPADVSMQHPTLASNLFTFVKADIPIRPYHAPDNPKVSDMQPPGKRTAELQSAQGGSTLLRLVARWLGIFLLGLFIFMHRLIIIISVDVFHVPLPHILISSSSHGTRARTQIDS